MTDCKRTERRYSQSKIHSNSPLKQAITRSPNSIHHHRHHRHHHRKRKRSCARLPETLPFDSHSLVKEDYKEYKHVFGLYLDIQKNKNLYDLDETEVKGRWKSFMRKWNYGELAEGWYDPSTKRKACENAISNISRGTGSDSPSALDKERSGRKSISDPEPSENSDSDQSFGPMLLGQDTRSRTKKLGPTIPLAQDLQLMSESLSQDRIARYEDIKYARKVERKEQKEALDELVPNSMPGTRERQLEKKKELNEKLKSFRERSPGAIDIPDSELMGDREDLESFKKVKQDMERKKNERELRKEALLRARAAEREERLREYRAKEQATIGMFKALAKQRFG